MTNLNAVLVGNPNTGKTAVFNQLTGLNQKVGNYPGVTLDKKQGFFTLESGQKITLTDLPGTYSLIPNASDELVATEFLASEKENIDVVIFIAEVENLKRNLLLFSQVKDLGLPCLLVVNMADQMQRKGIFINTETLSKSLQTDVILVSARKKEGFDKLKSALKNTSSFDRSKFSDYYKKIDETYFKGLEKNGNPYENWLKISLAKSNDKTVQKYLQKETIYRYQKIRNILKDSYQIDREKARSIGAKIDKILTHKIFGMVIFIAILLLMFQAVFTWSATPMDLIDEAFTNWAGWVSEKMPAGMLRDLICEGVIVGLGGVVIFIPQIATLSFFVVVLEEVGYMNRVVFLMDRLMRRFGMNGRSVISLISGTACAIPAIMATRSINSWKDRLITILVTPFTTCSARLPVYTILISLVIPNKIYGGIFNLQGVTMLALYLLGFLTAILSALVLQKYLKVSDKKFFIIEMPDYKIPLLKNIFLDVFQKTRSFVTSAGKIILALSIVIWFLSTNGGDDFKSVETVIKTSPTAQNMSAQDLQVAIASEKLATSYIGKMGAFIEPAIKPLGYDWKIGIALITSFAAREVFVGTLATIYGIDSEEETSIKERLAKERNPETGGARFDLACGLSLLIFYAFAMQCMGTLAVVKRETKSWKWPLLQLFGMGILAYIGAFLTRYLVLFFS